MLSIKNLCVFAKDKEIISDLSLNIKNGEIHAIMGQNGTGKSTLCKVLLNNPDYIIKKGTIKINNKDITKANTTDIAREGIFLLNQSPIAIEGVTNAEMLRMALSEIQDKQVNIFEFNKRMESICEKLEIPNSFIHREINVGMSGGERKKNELLHMWMLEPKFIILDEIDSGLDVDAIKIVANSLLEYYKLYQPSILIITHHNKILELIKPDYVHVMQNGRIVKSGDYSLAKEVEEKGFKAFNISGQEKNE